MNKLDGKVIVITGGSRGLGRAMARLFAQEGARIVLAARSRPALDSTIDELKETGARMRAYACDVGDPVQMEGLADFALKEYGRFDVWINNAGVGGPYGPTLDLDPADFQAVLRTNIFGTYYGSVTALRHYLPRRSGKLINILGAGDRGPVPNQNAYASSKAWIRVFTLALAREYRDTGVGIFAFQPGLMDTELLTDVKTFPGYEDRLKRVMPFLIRSFGRQPEIPARRALWLASSATDGKTGLYLQSRSTFAMLFGFWKEGLRRILHRKGQEVEMHVTLLRSAFKPQPDETERK